MLLTASALLGVVPLTMAPAPGQTTMIRIAPASSPPPPPASGGSTTPVEIVGERPTTKSAPTGMPPASKATTPANDAAKKAQERLQKIQRLGFDRRPSAILGAWSKAETPNETPKPATEADETPAPAPDPFDESLKALQLAVTRGRWADVGTILRSLPKAEGQAAYKRLIAALPNRPQPGAMVSTPGEPMLSGTSTTSIVSSNSSIMVAEGQVISSSAAARNPQFQEQNAFSVDDVIGLAAAAPHGFDEATLSGLGRVLRLAITQGSSIEEFVNRLRDAQAGPFELPLNRREAAKVLMAAGSAVEAGPFLPNPEAAEADNDREALNLLSRHYLALHAKDPKAEPLEQAWKVNQAVLAVGTVDEAQKAEALTRAVELAPKVREELGLRWLAESFTDRPDRGIEILTAIGSATAQGLQSQPMGPAVRQGALELQKAAVEALLAASPGRARSWGDALALLAGAWLREAEHSQRYDQSTLRGPRMQRDPFGNMFFLNEDGMNPGMMPNQGNMPRAIPVARVLESAPGPAWLGLIDDDRRPAFDVAFARLYLKVNEEERAFPHVERLAAASPEKALGLAEEFLRVWTRNHDPNADRNRTNPYMFMFGFERRAESIPLTRSKQERNLRELSGWIARLRGLPIGAIDEALLAQAFTTCHSSAEVYRLEAIREVFGPIDDLEPKTLAMLVQKMRENLAGLWRQPAVQDQAKTKRKEKDIQAEVFRGYEVARSVIDRTLERHPDEWPLVLARAALVHDENNYRQKIELSTDYAPIRREALDQFARAAALYAAEVPDLAESDETNQPFELWFHAGLGACDLGQIDQETQPNLAQPARIREAILALPGESAERHMSKFANALFTRMSAVNPAVKFRYLDAGFEIVGDREQAREARKVFDYYKDLVTEIRLDARIDGPDVVGHDRPFGLFVDIRHTREIERESGGFGRYLQNQSQGNTFFYNYGRPLENYREKFEKAAREALGEQFEVLSVTFQDEKVNSRAAAEYGWRVTPYAYLLLQAKGPEVDKIAPLRLDLDFLDTSGYAILPVESPSVPIDASPAEGATRPYRKLEITQTLDERQAAEGKLILEVKAVAQGLVPDLAEILEVESDGFEVGEVEDQGLSVSRFDPEADDNVVDSERSWLVSLKAAEGLAERPEVFHFASSRVDVAEMTRQRYVDADLEEVEPEVRLERSYGEPSRAQLPWIAGLAILGVLGLIVARRARPRARPAEAARFRIPEPLTPFTVLGLLREIRRDDGLSEVKERELADSIRDLEAHYFAGEGRVEPDLRGLAESWIRQAATANGR